RSDIVCPGAKNAFTGGNLYYNLPGGLQHTASTRRRAMRMAFGLVSVLVAMGAIVLIISNFYAPHTQVVLTEGRKAREEVSQMAGYGQDGLKATETVTLAPELRSDGKVDNLIVT